MNTQDIVALLVAARLTGQRGVVVRADHPIPIEQVLELIEPIEYSGPIADFFDDSDRPAIAEGEYKPFRERWSPDTVPMLAAGMAFVCELGAPGMDAGVWISVVNQRHDAPFRNLPHAVIEVSEADHVPV